MPNNHHMFVVGARGSNHIRYENDIHIIKGIVRKTELVQNEKSTVGHDSSSNTWWHGYKHTHITHNLGTRINEDIKS